MSRIILIPHLFMTWFRRLIGILFVRALLFWLFFIVLVVALYLPLFLHISPHEHIQHSAFILQLIAYLVLINGLNKIQKLFKGIGIVDSIINWFKLLFTIETEPKKGTGGINGDKGKLKAKTTAPEVELTLKTLDKRLKSLEKKINSLENDLIKEIKKEKQRVEIQIQSLNNRLRSFEKKLEVVHFDGLYTEFVALLWLIASLVILTLPPRIILSIPFMPYILSFTP